MSGVGRTLCARGWGAVLSSARQACKSVLAGSLLLLLWISPPLRAQHTHVPVQVWEFLTTADRTELMRAHAVEAQDGKTTSGEETLPPPETTIRIDDGQVFQQMQGFGYTLTQGSADLLAAMSAPARHRLLEEMFGNDPEALHLSVLRLPIGSTDLSRELYTLDDLPVWGRDEAMRHFSLQRDRATLLPVVHEILAIRPDIHVTAAPWTAPLWMKEALPGARFRFPKDQAARRSLLQTVLPVCITGVLVGLAGLVHRRRLRRMQAAGIAGVLLALLLSIAVRANLLREAYPLFQPMTPGGGHVAGLLQPTLEDATEWPRGRWHPAYIPRYARYFWESYQDSAAFALATLRQAVTNGRDWTGGRLRREEYAAYATYLTRYVQAMRDEGVPMDSITVQNESEANLNRPSMGWTAEEENVFVRDFLGPSLRRNGLAVKVIAFDHNVDHTQFPLEMLRDAKTNALLDGSSFHLYAGDIANMSRVHFAFPAKHLYFSEQMVIEDTRHGVRWPAAEPVQRILVGALRNWSETVMLWNLASNAEAGPHVPAGGCPACLGAVTLEGDAVTRNLGYVALAQVARFVPEGSVVVASNDTLPTLGNVALRTPDGGMALVVTNLGPPRSFDVVWRSMRFRARLEHNSVATYVWRVPEGSAERAAAAQELLQSSSGHAHAG